METSNKVRPIAIPTFRADGRQTRHYTLAAVERLLTLGLVVVSRSKKGRITCCQFKSDCGANPLVKTAHMGQRYSIEDQLPSGHHAWRHRELMQSQAVEVLFGERAESAKEIDLFIRAVFRAVPLSCMASNRTKLSDSKAAPAKVVSIERGRRKRNDAA